MTDLPTRRQLRWWHDEWRRIGDGLFGEGRLVELVERDQYRPTPDGYPTTASGAGGSGGGTRRDDGTPTSPTENAAEALTDDYQDHDPVHRTVEAVVDAIHHMLREGDRTVGRLAEASRLVEKHRGRQDTQAGSGRCRACDRYCSGNSETNDRLRSGYCHADFVRWTRAGRPDRLAFERSTPTKRREAS